MHAVSQGIRITRCRLRGTTAKVTCGELLYSAANGNEDSVRVERTRFESGTYGLLRGTATDNDPLLVQDNVLTEQSVLALFLPYAAAHHAVAQYREYLRFRSRFQ